MRSKQEENDLIWERFITESPWPYKFSSNINVGFRESNPSTWGTLSDKYKNFDVYENLKDEIYSLTFSLGIKPVAFYSYIPNEEYYGGVKTKFIWGENDPKKVFQDIFVGYILPKFKTIESDDMLTDEAFQFWINLMRNNPDLDFHAKIASKFKRLMSSDEIIKYKEKYDQENSTFIVSSANSRVID